MGWEEANFLANTESKPASHVGLNGYLSDARSDAYAAPAPTSAAQRVWDVTTEGVTKIPEGFIHSLDPSHIIPNVGMGILIGAGTKFLLPAGGPVAKVAGALLATYFVGKPLYDTYSTAYHAETMADMHRAAGMFGDTVGGLPVGMLEGGVGARIGSGFAGGVLGMTSMQGFANWKTAQYAKFDTRIDNGVASLSNFAFDRFGIGGPVMRAGTKTGFIPPYVLETLAKRNPANPDYLNTIRQTEQLGLASTRTQDYGFRIAEQRVPGAREVYDAKGEEVVGVKVRSEGDPKIGNRDADNVYDYTGDVRDYYRDVHQRSSIDGKGMPMQSTVNYGQNYENAFWDGTRMTYGKPGAESPFETFVLRDVTGHEITHGVTEYEAGLVYRGQPGALNESLSDVFGALVEQKARNQSAAEASWLVGDGIWKPGVKGRALRDMQQPGTAYNDPAIGVDPQPAHMKDFVRTRSDNGGVHINSGIPNRAFSLFAKDVGGFAWEKAGPIWYKARANAGASPSFAQFAYQTLEAAKQLGYESEIPKLQKAWADVGVKPSATDTGFMDGAVAPVMTTGDTKRIPQLTTVR